MQLDSLLTVLQGARVYDLGHPYYPGMPHVPTHPPFLFGLTKLHGDSTYPNGVSSASDALALSGHTGTHMDALCHFSVDGRLHGGTAVGDVQSYGRGIGAFSIETAGPLLRRGVLLDVARQQGVDALAEDFEILPEHLDAAVRGEIRAGDVVLLRTGWDRFWEDAPRYVNQVRGPGPGEAAARWLSSRRIFAAGSDTLSFERVPCQGMPVHAHLLVEKGIHLFECLDLRPLAEAGISEFLFIAAPLKIRGGTASPVRPVAVVP